VNDAAAGGLARETPLAQGTPLAPNPAPESVSAPAQSAAVPARNSPSRDAQTDLSAATTTPTVSDGLGSEQLNSQKDMPEVVTATVVSVTRGRFDTLYFHFENGQVWRQIQPRRFRYPKDGEFKVTIGTGIMGDYQLRVEGDGPMTRIRRIR
jgi:hypothetical protein